MSAQMRHNVLVPDLLEQLLSGTRNNESEGLVVLESLILGFLLTYHPRRLAAIEALDFLTAGVVGRLPE